MHHLLHPKALLLRFLLLCLVLAGLFGCMNYYKPVTRQSGTTTGQQTTINENISQQKYFILRHASGNYAMHDVQVDAQTQQLHSRLGSLPAEHTVYTTNSPKNYYRFKKYRGEKAVLNEVHMYLKGTQKLDTTKVIQIPLNDLEKIEVIEFDKGRTTASYILGGVGITLGAIAVTGVIALLTKSSCPFVSVYDGQRYNVQGELFGGAIYPSLEREDYVPLQITPVNNEYRIRISNELQEKQYTNFAKLMVITHDKKVRAFTDEGKVYTVAQTIPPLRAVLNDQQDQTASVAAKDNLFCNFNDAVAKDNINSLVLHFGKPAGKKEVKLLLQLKNAYWFDYLYGEFTKAFGSYYPTWIKKQKKVPVHELEKWSKEQHIPLTVSVKTTSGWKEVRVLKTIGPLAAREVLIPLNLEDVSGTEVQVKLTTGFMFWELDYAGIDYSPQAAYTLTTIDPYSAIDERGKNVLPSLLSDDKLYLDQPLPGMAAIVNYKWDKSIDTDETTTVLLHTKGYYEHTRNYYGKPKITFLKNFRNPGAFAAFSREQYQQVSAQRIIAINR